MKGIDSLLPPKKDTRSENFFSLYDGKKYLGPKMSKVDQNYPFIVSLNSRS